MLFRSENQSGPHHKLRGSEICFLAESRICEIESGVRQIVVEPNGFFELAVPWYRCPVATDEEPTIVVFFSRLGVSRPNCLVINVLILFESREVNRGVVFASLAPRL